ncbi:oxidoreductase [Tenacibaculum sp. MEBiC06402]|uniref:WD40/YVTN/BNR-like repeat-containing protein n=1 Tax=unclassified Tenacibaculum TaxID=2635139 RepID=UPI003B9D2E19
MKPYLTIISLSLFFFSCKEEHTAREVNNIELEITKIDSTSIRSIHAISDKKVYFAGSNGKIGFTNDGGKTWNIETISFQDSIQPHFRSMVKTKEALFTLSIANPALLYKIDDSQKLVYTENHEKVFYDSMKFFDNEIDGIAVGDPTDNCPSILITNDGGNSWSKVSCEKLPDFEDGEAFFAASNTNIKIINNTVWIASGGKKARILKSSDKGKTWSIHDTPIVQGNGPQGIYSIDFYDENNGIIIGGDYSKPNDNFRNKAVTKDGGKTWEIIADNENPNYKSCVKYVPKSNGKEIFAVGKTGISYSNDAGKSWKNLSDEGFYAIDFVNENTAWLSGNEKIAKLSVQ